MNYALDVVQMPPQEGFEGMTSGFSDMPQSTVPNGADVGISPHAVGQHSDWPAAEAVKSHIKLRPHHCFWIVFLCFLQCFDIYE